MSKLTYEQLYGMRDDDNFYEKNKYMFVLLSYTEW